MRVALVGAELEENLSVRYLWGSLERAGHEVSFAVFDDRAGLDRAARELAQSGAALAGFSMVFTSRAREFADLAARARALGFRGHLTAGGHFAAFHAEDLLRDLPDFDSMIVGEGEEALVDLAAHLDAPQLVRGLVWRDGDRVVRNPLAEKPVDLDALALPRRMEPFDRFLGLPIVNLLGSRGCTHSCVFCSISAWHRCIGGPRLRLRSPEKIADEMAALYRRGVRIFNFHDDNFFLPRREEMLARVRDLLSALDRRGVGPIAFAVKARPGSVDEDLFKLLRDAGLFRVFLGIEAGTNESLRRLGRGQTFAENERALDIVNRLDIHAAFNLLLLNPDSTLEDLEANIAFLRAHPHNPMNFCRTEVYTGTPLERKLRREGRLRGDYWGWDYRIADPRAQSAFEVMYPAFEMRNYGVTALHHLTMAVDYEHQLLARFFGSRAELRKQVKDFIVEVNLNTCGHLETLCEGIRHGTSPASLATRLGQAVARDNDRLSARAQKLIATIRTAARTKPQRSRSSPWAKRAAAAGLAATMGLPIAAVVDPKAEAKTTMQDILQGQREKALKKVPTHMLEMAVIVLKQPPKPSRQTKDQREVVRAEFEDRTLPSLAGLVLPKQGLEIKLRLSSSGRITRFTLPGVTVPRSFHASLHAWLMTQHYDVRLPSEQEFEFAFTAQEVDSARRLGLRLSPSTQVSEMAPMRPNPRAVARQLRAQARMQRIAERRIRPAFVRQTLPLLAPLLPPHSSLQVTMSIGTVGCVVEPEIQDPSLSGEPLESARKLLETQCYEVPEAYGQQVELTFTAREVDRARKLAESRRHRQPKKHSKRR